MFNLRKKKEAIEPEAETQEATGATMTGGLNQDEAVASPEEDVEEPESESETKPEKDYGDNAGTEVGPEFHYSLVERFDKWCEDKEIHEGVKENALRMIGRVETAIVTGVIDNSIYDYLLKGADYSRAVREAAAAGELKGRNARIEELMIQEEDGDGVPHPGNANAPDSGRAPSIFELARACR